jgi:hypothetical protein
MIVPVASAQTVDINALLAQIAQLTAVVAQLQAGQGGGAAAGVSCSFTRDLTVGVTAGSDVQCLQRFLNASGFQVAASGAGLQAMKQRLSVL